MQRQIKKNRGKEFEGKFFTDFKEIEEVSIDRIYDTMGEYKGISNICDFIGYVYPYIYYLEVKSTTRNTFALSKLTQYDKLVKKIGTYGVNAGVMIWFIDHQKVCWVDIEEFERIKNLGLKSINIKMLGDPNYSVIEMPSTLLRVNLRVDYNKLIKQTEEKWQNRQMPSCLKQ